MDKQIEKIMHIQTFIKKGSKYMEVFFAFCVFVGILVVTFRLFISENLLIELFNGHVEFMGYLEAIFNIVIGIEFMEMLCRPDSSNVLEILIFIMARHMIVGHTTTIEDFISVIGICILCIVRRFLRINKEKLIAEGVEHEDM